MQEIGSLVKAGAKKPPAVGLLDSVVMVVMLMRRNATQAAAAAHFHCSQPTASRRSDLLRPVIGKVLAPYVPDPVQVLGREGTAQASGINETLQKSMAAGNTGADLCYIGVDDIGIVPFKRLSGAELLDWQREFNTIFSKIRAAVEHAVAKVKTWRMLSREGGRYRCPIDKFESMLAAVTGLFFFAEYSND